MSDERKRRAGKARVELSETHAAFERMRANAIEALFASKDGETALREQLYRAVSTIDAVRGHLDALVQDGVIAEHEDEISRILGR